MELLPNGFTLEIPDGAFPLSTDSMVLSAFVRLPRNARVLDLGSGCGTIGLLLCSRDTTCTVTGLEIDERAHLAAVENIRRNGLEPRMESICADLRSVSERFSPGSFDLCVSNPPYFTGGPVSKTVPLARREDLCSPDALFRVASHALKYGGDFFLVHRPERMAELIARGAEAGLEAKRLRLVRHQEGSAVSLVLLQFRKGAKPGLHWEELALHRPDGSPTAAYREIYHI